MATMRFLTIPCPTCGHVGRYALEPTEFRPLVTLVTCQSEEGGCETPFAVEVQLRVQIEYSTCRLALPSTTPRDCLEDLGRRTGPDSNNF